MPERESSMKIALVTGASSGLGKEFVCQLDKRSAEDFEVFWLLARREERLQELASTLTHPSEIWPLDLRSAEDLARLEAALQKEKPQIRILVNVAGLGKAGPFAAEEGELKEISAEIDVNVKALTLLTALASPYLEKGSKVFEIASVAAFLPQPGFAVYAACKAYVLSLSRALAAAWKPRGITVTAVCPNPMETEFFLRTGADPADLGLKKFGVEKVDAVVRHALRRAQRGKDISLSSVIPRLIHLSSKILPTRWILAVEKLLGLY